MKLNVQQDVEAPQEAVFAAIADFGAFERLLVRHGGEVRRTDAIAAPAPGMAWQVRVPLRGKPRDIAVRLASWTPESALGMAADSSGILATITVELLPLSRRQTRMAFAVDLRAVTLTSKLLLRSLTLTKGSLERRLAGRIARFAGDIEKRASRQRRSG